MHNYRNITPNIKLAKTLNFVAWILSIVVLSTVLMMRRIKIETDFDFSFLPQVHAWLNTGVTVCLILALYFVRQGKILMHQKFIYGAMVLSFLFLVSYVLYHFTEEEVRYCKDGMIRYIYFFILLTHILLAGVSFPFILFTFVKGFTYQIASHRKMAKYVFPIWLYVAVTGPIVYVMLKPCY
ncbi:MAG: DUF420 domain-containing protein [Saprospiraceae bacterium]